MERIAAFVFKIFVALIIFASLISSGYTQVERDNIATVYYVSLQGNDDNSGLTEMLAWRHISYAASRATIGDKVFIKAGDYGAENIVFTTDGTKDKPIVFEGYQNIPGDNPDLDWSYADSLDALVMPLLDGGNRAEGVGIELSSRSFITVKNFQIKNYETGIYAWGARNIVVENIIAMSFGDIEENYSGGGIIFGSEANGNIIKNSIVYNAAAEGISVVGDNNIIEASKVYADDNSTGYKSATDYYIHISGNNNLVKNNYAERVGNLEHVGHGIGIKGDGENNIIRECKAKNFSGAFYLRHSGVKNNLIENCTAINSDIGLLIRDGASNNIIKNCRIFNSYDAIVFFYTKEDERTQSAGSNNLITNCLVKDSTNSVISFNGYGYAAKASNNRFRNCVFDTAPLLFESERDNENNMLTNSIVTGIQDYKKGSFKLDIDFAYNDFWNNGFSAPSASNSVNLDPLFVDSASNDYHLMSQFGRWDDHSKTWLRDNKTSLAIDAGNPDASYDLEPEPSGNRINLGIFGNTSYASKSAR